MQWTKDKPTVEGWYWTFEEDRPDLLRIEKLVEYTPGVLAWIWDNCPYPLDKYGDNNSYWYGPIDPPELPK